MNTKIDYLDKCINVICGCTNGCWYCWARKRVAPRLAHNCKKCGQFIPHFHEERLKQIARIKKPSIIGLNFMGDTWDKESLPSWRHDIFLEVEKNWRSDFIVLTKQPQNIKEEKFGSGAGMPGLRNLWVGVSIDRPCNMDLWVGLSQKEYIQHKIISFEPIISDMDICRVIPYFLKYGFPGWIIIGALTKSPERQMQWSRYAAEHFYKVLLTLVNRPPIFVKDNVGMKNAPKEYPKELT